MSIKNKYNDYFDTLNNIKIKYNEDCIVIEEDGLFCIMYGSPCSIDDISKVSKLLNCHISKCRSYRDYSLDNNPYTIGFPITKFQKYIDILFQHYSIICIRKENFSYNFKKFKTNKTIINEHYSPNFKKKLIEQVYSYKI